MSLEFTFIDNGLIGSIAFFLTSFVLLVIWGIVSKKYIAHNLMEIDGIEYNSYKTIILHTIKIYFKYAFIFALIVIVAVSLTIIVLMFFALRSADIFNGIYDQAWLETYLTEYLDSIIDSITESTYILFFFISILLMFFKLMFIEDVLVFKQENYKIKNIVKESYAIIKTDRLFFMVTFFGINFLLSYLWEIYFKHNHVYIIFESVVYLCLSMVYLIKFTEVKKKEYGIQ
jgi:hypothetical protein